MSEIGSRGQDGGVDVFEVFVEERRGLYNASIPGLSLMESGTDIADVSTRIIARARLATETLSGLNLYTPIRRTSLFRQETTASQTYRQPAFGGTSKQIRLLRIALNVLMIPVFAIAWFTSE